VALGRPKLKNIAQREPVYALLPEKPAGFRQRLRVQQLKLNQWRRPLQVAALLILLTSAGLIGRYFYLPSPSGLPLPDKPSLVVLPFVNLSGDPGQEYFSDGITEELTASLSRLSSLFVVSRNSAFFYKGKAVKLPDLSQELGVQYVLEGSVRKADGQVRITAQLIDATTDRHLWSERYERPPTDIFALQDEIVQKIVTTLKLQLMLWQHGVLVRKRTDNLEAYDSYLRGWESFYRSTKEANAQARQMFEKAIELDPQYVGAYVALGISYWLVWSLQWSSDPQTLERAFTLAQKAIELDDSLPGAHSVLSYTYLWKRQFDRAVAEAERAVALNPNCDSCYLVWGTCLNGVGRPEEAIPLLEKAMRLNPRYPSYYVSTLGWSYLLSRSGKEAIAALRQALSRDPNNVFAHLGLAIVYSELGREEKAQAAVAEVLRLSPNFSLEGARQSGVSKDSATVERLLAALQKAGLK
jgi:adenylate cyclase